MFATTRSLFVLLCLGLLLLPVGAQPPAGGGMDREREEVAANEIPSSNQISALARTIQSPEPDNLVKSDLAAAEKVIKYYLYRLTWDEVQKERDPAKVGTISSIMNEIVGGADNPKLFPRPFVGPPSDQDAAATRQRQVANVQAMTPLFIKHCKVVLQNKAPIARINAARVLAKLAEWGQEPVVDEFIAIINNPAENDVVRHWAFRGLEDLFTLQNSNDIRGRGLFQGAAGAARMNKALGAVYAWLDSRTKLPEAKLQYMKAEEQAGLRYIRRAAARALGASRKPLIVDDRAANKQEGPIAELLNKIVTADAGVQPAPDLRERLDAALAICQLRGDASPSYQPDYIAFHVGKFLIEMGSQANTDKDNKDTPAVNWRYEAHRLKLALDGFVKQKSSGAATGYLSNFMGKADALLKFFDDFATNTDAVKSLSDWLRDNNPPSDSIYKKAGVK